MVKLWCSLQKSGYDRENWRPNGVQPYEYSRAMATSSCYSSSSFRRIFEILYRISININLSLKTCTFSAELWFPVVVIKDSNIFQKGFQCWTPFKLTVKILLKFENGWMVFKRYHIFLWNIYLYDRI